MKKLLYSEYIFLMMCPKTSFNYSPTFLYASWSGLGWRRNCQCLYSWTVLEGRESPTGVVVEVLEIRTLYLSSLQRGRRRTTFMSGSGRSENHWHILPLAWPFGLSGLYSLVWIISMVTPCWVWPRRKKLKKLWIFAGNCVGQGVHLTGGLANCLGATREYKAENPPCQTLLFSWTNPPKSGRIEWTNLAVHEWVDSRFLVLPGSESTITEITEYIYFSPLKHCRECKYKSG